MCMSTANLIRSVMLTAHASINTFTLIFPASVSSTMTTKTKLPNVTFTINEPPMKHLLWCNKVPRGKRNKLPKVNGVTHQELYTKP